MNYPKVSVIIPLKKFNKKLKGRIEHSLKLDYPALVQKGPFSHRSQKKNEPRTFYHILLDLSFKNRSSERLSISFTDHNTKSSEL